MTSSSRVRMQMAADRAHRRMKKKSHVAHGEPGDRADLPVAEAAQEPEMDHLTLIAGEGVENAEDLDQRLARIVPVVEVARDGDFSILERFTPGGLPPRVEREVAAHGEQPRRHVLADAVRVLAAHAEERLLHHVPRRLVIAQQPRRIADQRPFMLFQRVCDPIGFQRPAHGSLWR